MKFICILILSTILVFSQEKLTLKKAIENALENNYQIKLSKKNIEIAVNNNNIGNAGFLPSITAGGNYSLSEQSGRVEIPGNTIFQDRAERTQIGADITLNWTLFDGFAMFTNYDRLNLLERSSVIQYQIAIENNLRDVVSNYINVINTLQNIENLKKSLELSNDRLSLVESRFEYGAVTGAAVLQAKVDLNSDSSALLSAEIELANSERSLKYSMGIKSDKNYTYENDINFLVLDNITELKKRLFEKNSSINSAINQERISQKDRELILATFYPRLDFTAGYQYSSVENAQGFPSFSESYGPSASLNASINLLDGLRRFQNLENSEINLEMASIQIEDIKSSIEYNLLNLYDTYTRQSKLINLEESNLKTAEENYKRAESSYDLGNLTSIELREAQLNLLLSQNRLSNARASKKQTEGFILLLIGEIPYL